jgi:lipoate-protein ligase A
MRLHLLPTRTGGAAENMAFDLLLLQRYPEKEDARFRHYDWRSPAFTFGLSQKLAFIREQLPGDGAYDLCRRPTGGGLVDHRNDWTYALGVPRGHPLEEIRATQSYRLVHEQLACALAAQGIAAVLKPTAGQDPGVDGAREGGGPAGVCFERAELFDVVNGATGQKIAGAAQKRNRSGLLMQGSIDRAAAGGEAVDWERLEADFTGLLAGALGAKAGTAPWPEFAEDEVEALIGHYSSEAWMDYR